jgi:ParB family chromosome partitioning protein
VRSTEEIVSLGGQQEKAKRASASRTTVPEYDDIASGLADKLETRVTITSGRSRGKLTVEFAGSDDLHRILDALGIRTTTN